MQITKPQNPLAEPLLLTPRQAAQALAISERTLWTLTAPRGPLQSVLVGRSVRYSVEHLREWIAKHAERAEQGAA